MKALIIADLHGSYYYAKQIIDIFNQINADKLVILGDVLYHGPRNDLPKDYCPKAIFALLNKYKDKIICIRGNCDSEVDQMVLEFDVTTTHKTLSLDGVTAHLLHGHQFERGESVNAKQGEIVLYGHTHVYRDETVNGVRFLNPGSISIPKQNSGHGYIIFDNGKFTRYTIE